jgi:hypothetical protein
MQVFTLHQVVEITPEPDGMEREAILAALAADAAQERRASPWAQELLPGRDGEPQEP